MTFSGNADLGGGGDLYVYDDEGNSAYLCGTSYTEGQLYAGAKAAVVEDEEC